MTHPKLKIAGSLVAVAAGVMLGWLTLEWLLDAIENDNVQLVASHLGEKLWMQLKFATLCALVGLSVFWGAIVARRWNLVVRLFLLSLFAVGAQWAIASVKWMQIAATAPEGNEEFPAMIYLGNLGTEWVPIATLVAVWVMVVPLLFKGKAKSDGLAAGGDAEAASTEIPQPAPADTTSDTPPANTQP